MARPKTPPADVNIRARVREVDPVLGPGEIKLLICWTDGLDNGAVKAKVDVTEPVTGVVFSAEQLYFDTAGNPVPTHAHCLEIPAPGTGALNPDAEYSVQVFAFDALSAPINRETCDQLRVKTPKLPVNPAITASLAGLSFSIRAGRTKTLRVDAQEPSGTPLNNVLTRFSLENDQQGRLSTPDSLEASSLEIISNLSKESVTYHAPAFVGGPYPLTVEVPGSAGTARAVFQITVT